MHSHLFRSRFALKRYGTLHVIAPIFNPVRYVSRYYHLQDFSKHVASSGAVLWVAEVAFGDRPWEACLPDGSNHLKMRTLEEIWLKESVINEAVSHLPTDWEYVAWVDADVMFANPDWVQETIQQLQHNHVVQMFEQAVDLDASGIPSASFKGFVASVIENGDKLPPADERYYGKKNAFHPGYAWACSREAWNKMGGLLDINIVGGGDHQMAHGWYGNAAKAIPAGSTAGYRRAVMAWQQNALLLNKDLGFVPGTLLHHYHGPKVQRGYFDRWKILSRNKFCPVTDLKRDNYGLWQLSGNKPALRDEMRVYFRGRNEDAL